MIKYIERLAMSHIVEGNFVMGNTKVGMVHGMVEHVMLEGGILGTPGSEYAIASMPPDNPAMSVRIYKDDEDNGNWKETAYTVGMMHNDATKLNTLEGHIMSSKTNTDEYDNSIGKEYKGCGCATCKRLNVDCPDCPVCQEDMGKNYNSEDEEEDKWDNIEKACWVGYRQQGMKPGRNGGMVPNCVPVGKSDETKSDNTDDEIEKVSSKRFKELVETYNKNKEGNKRISVGTLQAVYRRGIGAYRTNPGSVRPNVSSAEQWAMARVNAFMAGLRGKFPSKSFDLDLFPKGHPRATKKSLFKDFAAEVQKPESLTKIFDDQDIESTQPEIVKSNSEWKGSAFDVSPFKTKGIGG